MLTTMHCRQKVWWHWRNLGSRFASSYWLRQTLHDDVISACSMSIAELVTLWKAQSGGHRVNGAITATHLDLLYH